MLKGVLAATALFLAADGVLDRFAHTRHLANSVAAFLHAFSASFHASLFGW